MTKQFVAEMKKLLEAQRAKLEEELKGFAGRSSRSHGGFATAFPDFGDKEDENAAEVATFSDNLSLERTLETNLHDVERALARIKTNSYGVCKYCGKEIDQRRLRARPESSSCMDCKTKRLGRR